MFPKHAAFLNKLQNNFVMHESIYLTKPSAKKIYCGEKRKTSPTLTIKGFIIHCTNALTNVVEKRFDWNNAMVDAAITSGVTFFSTLGGGSAAGLGTIAGIKVAVVAAFSQFFIFLALKRGIVQQKEAPIQ